MACRYSNTESNIETVKLSLEHPNININIHNNNGRTALMLACGVSNTDSSMETVKLLLEDPNIDVNKQDKEGYTALMTICRFCDICSDTGAIELLLKDPNMDVNKQDNKGNTALMIALIALKSCSRDREWELAKIIVDIFMDSKINIYSKNLEEKSIIDLIPISKEFIEIIYNNRIWVNNSNLKRIIAMDSIDIELLIPQIFNPFNFDYEILIEILKKHKNRNKIIYYCNLHTNIKKEALEKIQIQKEELYCRPDNIIALCSEINFKLNFKNPIEVFNELDEKLKYIFDIQDEEDMIKKITFYL